MAWLAIDKNGIECIFKRKPVRNEVISGVWSGYPYIDLPSGSIAKLIGREMTWEDEPIEIK